MPDPLTILPGAEPFLLRGGDTGCLLIHGFTGTPYEMRSLGEYLAGQGHTVLGVRLTGHATRIQDLPHTRWQDWYGCALDGYHQLRAATRKLFVFGLSMGGSLALLLSARQRVDGVFAMAAPLNFRRDWRFHLLPLLAVLQPFRPKGERFWADPQAAQGFVSYTDESILAYRQLAGLLETLQTELGSVRAPAQLIYSHNDPTVRAADGHAEAVYAGLGSTDKHLHWLENSGHILPRDAGREDIFRLAGAFIERCSQAGQ